MEMGMVGLGRMGGNMAERLLRHGHRIVASDPNPDARARAAAVGAIPVESLSELVEALPPPRAVWLMVPAGDPVDETMDDLSPLLAPGDVIVDGGNSYYKDTLRRAKRLGRSDIQLIDAGTSGGVWGLAEGYSLMIGGDAEAVERLRPVFETLAPAADAGWGRVGPVGAGHFAKMVHNGIEYGMMQAYAEGFALMNAKTQFDLDLRQVAHIWRDGSVVRSWLLELACEVLADNPSLDGIAPYVADSGEGRWTVFESIDLNVPAPVVSLALLQRIRSRDDVDFADRLLAALRNRFGGHAVQPDA